MVYKCQLSISIPEGKNTIKRQLYTGPYTLKEAPYSNGKDLIKHFLAYILHTTTLTSAFQK